MKRIRFEIRTAAERRASARWIALVPLAIAVAAAGLAHSVGAQGNSQNTAGEWISLFDGSSMEHWQDPSKLDPPGDAWTIADGCLKAVPHPRITEDLVSQETYTNFELEFEWRVANGGNSGLKYRIQAFPILTSENHVAGKFENQVQAALVGSAFNRSLIKPGMRAQIYVVGFEYQTIAGNHPDALRGPLYQSGALYGMIPPVRDAMRPVAEFNRSRLVVRGNHIEHWLNGEKIVDGDLGADAVKQLTAQRWGESSEVYKLLAGQPNKACHISLQNHGDSAWFRGLRIRRLP